MYRVENVSIDLTEEELRELLNNLPNILMELEEMIKPCSQPNHTT